MSKYENTPLRSTMGSNNISVIRSKPSDSISSASSLPLPGAVKSPSIGSPRRSLWKAKAVMKTKSRQKWPWKSIWINSCQRDTWTVMESDYPNRSFKKYWLAPQKWGPGLFLAAMLVFFWCMNIDLPPFLTKKNTAKRLINIFQLVAPNHAEGSGTGPLPARSSSFSTSQ